ncbi:MAG: hypothetical protein KIS92_05215 [Planctomycetota bacterium]|nr:hypothetical protein [Planctomycetota bacterium]
MRSIRVGFATGVLLAAWAAGGWAEDGGAAAAKFAAEVPVVPGLKAAPTIDGDPSDAAWKDALRLPIEEPADVSKRPAKAKGAADVRLAMDAENLYVLFRCAESDPAGPWVCKEKLEREGLAILGSDYVAIEIFGGKFTVLSYLQIYADASGACKAYAIHAGGGMTTWDGYSQPDLGIHPVCAARVDVASKSWYVEMKLPLSQILRHPRDGVPQHLNFNFRRVQWGAERGHKPRADWTGMADFLKGKIHYEHMATWKPLEFGVQRKSATSSDVNRIDASPHVPAYHCCAPLNLSLHAFKNPLVPPERITNDYEVQYYAFVYPRVEVLDEDRPTEFAKLDARAAIPDPTFNPAAAFAEKPAVAKDGAGWRIRFRVKEAVDAHVAVVDGRGKVVRHLASGVLGANAPEPFAKHELAQDLRWDGADDDGRALPAGTYRVRVSLRLTPSYSGEMALGKFTELSSYKFLDLENLPNPKVDAKGMTNIDHAGGANNIVEIDRARNELYLSGQIVHDATTGQELRNLNLFRDEKGNPKLSGSLAKEGEIAFGRDGFLYVRSFNDVMRFDASGNPANFADMNVNFCGYLLGSNYNPLRGICTGGPDGDVYVVHGYAQHGNGSTQISRIGLNGRIKSYGLVTFPTQAGGVRVDRKGNVYVGCTIRPAGALVPSDMAKSLSAAVQEIYKWSYGSIVKFDKNGGCAELDPAGAFLLCKTGQAKPQKCSLQGALWVHPGYSPMTNRTGGPGDGPRCACHSPRFDLDDFERVYIPDGLMARVEIADANGNTMLFFGKRGGNPQHLEFRYPSMVAANDEFCYVVDYVMAKCVRVKLGYACSEEIPVAK